MEARLARLDALFKAILDEARSNRAFAERLESALSEVAPPSRRRGNRRAKAALDPFVLFEKGEEHLRAALGKLDMEQLKDVVAEYGMDRSRLALKWKAPERIIDLVVDTVKARARKGDAFRSAPRPTAQEPETPGPIGADAPQRESDNGPGGDPPRDT